MKKKILILCIDFPPWPSVGAQRPASWCKYADDSKYELVVVTRKWKNTRDDTADYFINPTNFPDEGHFGNAKIFYTNFKPNLRDKIILHRKNGIIFKVIQKILTTFYYTAPYFIRIFDNTREIYYKTDSYIKGNTDVSLIVATGEPFITFRYAYLLSRKYKIPWCADYRDGWSENYGIKYMPALQRFILRHILRKLEKKMVTSASLITTVTPSLKKSLEKFLGKKVHVIYNGYDPKEIELIIKEPSHLSEKFTIAYLGSLYPFQPLEEFADFLGKFLTEKIIDQSKLSLTFIGGESYKERIKTAFSSVLNETNLQILPRLERNKALSLLYSSHLLLLLASDSVDGSAAKIYEYFALKKPIFIYKNDHGTIKNLVEYTNAGFLYSDYESAKHYLLNLYNCYLTNNREAFITSPLHIENFSRKNQTARFFELT